MTGEGMYEECIAWAQGGGLVQFYFGCIYHSVIIYSNFGSDSRGWNDWGVEKNTGIPASSTSPVPMLGRKTFTLSLDFINSTTTTPAGVGGRRLNTFQWFPLRNWE